MSATKHRRKPYLPDSDLGKKEWMERFIAQLERDPERYGFDDPRMFEYVQRTVRTFIKAANAVANPAQRSPNATLVKNQARAKAVEICRDIAMQLKWDPTMTIEEKSALGLHLDEASPPPEKAKLPAGAMPGTVGYPQLVVLSSPSGAHVIRYRDPLTPAKAKPRGVSHFLLFGAIGEKPNMQRTHARLLGAYTKRPFEIMYPMGCALEGLYVTYYGRWLTTRGEMSPWSRPVSKIIGETQTTLRETAFAHLFGKEGFIDALPQGVVQQDIRIDEDRPLLESDGSGADGLFASLMGGGQQILEATVRKMLDAA